MPGKYSEDNAKKILENLKNELDAGTGIAETINNVEQVKRRIYHNLISSVQDELLGPSLPLRRIKRTKNGSRLWVPVRPRQ